MESPEPFHNNASHFVIFLTITDDHPRILDSELSWERVACLRPPMSTWQRQEVNQGLPPSQLSLVTPAFWWKRMQLWLFLLPFPLMCEAKWLLQWGTREGLAKRETQPILWWGRPVPKPEALPPDNSRKKGRGRKMKVAGQCELQANSQEVLSFFLSGT